MPSEGSSRAPRPRRLGGHLFWAVTAPQRQGPRDKWHKNTQNSPLTPSPPPHPWRQATGLKEAGIRSLPLRIPATDPGSVVREVPEPAHTLPSPVSPSLSFVQMMLTCILKALKRPAVKDPNFVPPSSSPRLSTKALFFSGRICIHI